MTPRAPSILRRGSAFFLDQLPVVLYMGALAGGAWGLARMGQGALLDELFASSGTAQAAGLMLVTLPVVMYHACWEGSRFGATPGKMLLGLQVQRQGGGRLPLERAALRGAVKFLPWELSHTLLWRLPGWPGGVEAVPPGFTAGLAAVWLLVLIWLAGAVLGTSRRTVYDRVSGARVVSATRLAASPPPRRQPAAGPAFPGASREVAVGGGPGRGGSIPTLAGP